MRRLGRMHASEAGGTASEAGGTRPNGDRVSKSLLVENAPCGIPSSISRSEGSEPPFNPTVGLCAGLPAGHSHSMVPGGFEVTSKATRFTPSTSLMMRVDILSESS